MARVLLVDDEPDIRRFVVRMLAGAGHDVVELGDGRAAIEVLAHEPPDCVVLDLVMPDFDGFAVLTARRERQLAPSTRFLVLSGRTADRDHLRAYDLGADDYLTKPFRGEDLVAKVADLLSASPLELEERREEERQKAAFLTRVESAMLDES